MSKFILVVGLMLFGVLTMIHSGVQTAGEIITASIYRVQTFQANAAYASTNESIGTIGEISVHSHIKQLRNTTAKNCLQGGWLLDDAAEKYSLNLVDADINKFLTDRIGQICHE